MKKFYLAAAAAVVAVSANAQFNASSPYVDASVTAGEVKTFDVFAACDEVMQGLKNAGQKVNDYRVDDVTRFMYIWENTFSAGDGSYPGVGYSSLSSEGYTSLTVGTIGWSGAGYNINKGAGIDLSHCNDATRVHVAYMSFGAAPESVALIFADGDVAGSGPAKVSVGAPFVDNGATYPSVGAASNDDWQAVDVTLGELKKLYPSFNFVASTEWTGNIMSILAGGVAGKSISIDAFYFYTPGDDSAVEGVEEDAALVVTGNTVNSTVAGIQVYDLAGKLVKATEGTVLGVSDLSGVYVVKSGNTVKKIVK